MSQASSRSLDSRGGFGALDGLADGEPLKADEAKSAWMVFGGLLVLLVAAYWNMIEFTSTYWAKDMYSHGWIIPLFSAYLFWTRKRPLMQVEPIERWIGVAVVAACLLGRVYFAYFDFNNPERLSFIGALLGVCLIVGGKSMLFWAGPAIGFLLFMFPLPALIESTLLMKLQTMATILSTWTLQTLGVSAARMGNTISIDTLKEPLQVAEACSGLRMLTIFGAMSVALVMIIDRPWWDKLAILLSAIPIALISNVVRIVSTALLYMAFGQSDTGWVHTFIHDGAGYAMMFIGLGLLAIELAVLSRLTVPVDSEEFAGFGAASA